jgi:hypothetical protein
VILWRSYIIFEARSGIFFGGKQGKICTTKLENNIIHFKVTGVQFKHYYFEQCLMGYFQKAIKIFGKKTVAKQVKSLSSGDDELYFQYALKDS